MTVDTATGVRAAEPPHEHTDEVGGIERAARRRFVRASAIGGILAVALFAWLITRGTFDFFAWQRVSEFYDQQARSFLHGRFAVDSEYLGIEAFTVNGTSNIYQGPIPAVLRVPVIALFGGALDGRLTQVSMLAAYVVAIVFAVRIHWKVRSVVRPGAPMTAGESFLVGLFTFGLAAGSSLMFEGSRAWVYHEALLWGAAVALAALDSMIAYVRAPSPARLWWTAFFAGCCLLTRASVGMGPVAGLGLLLVGALALRLVRRWPGRVWRLLLWLAPDQPRAALEPDHVDDTPRGRRAGSPWWLMVATVLPVAAYAAVNYIKFERLFSIPFYGQRFTEIDPTRQEFLRVNGGTMFGLQFAPTTLLQYLRPDAIRFVGHFPFLDFAPFPGRVIGDVTFDLIDRSSSVPTAMPLLTALALIGIVALFRPRAWHAPDLRAPLRVPLLAAGAAAATVIPFGYIANRYLTDFVPLLAVAGAVGLQVIVPWLTGPAARWWSKAVVAGVVVLAAFGVWVNLGLALNYQRLWSYNLHPPVVAGYLGFQDDLGGIGPVERVEHGAPLPDGIGNPGRLVAVGRCEALYLSDGLPLNAVKTSPWNAVEQTRAAGHLDLVVTFPEQPAGTRVPILGFADSRGVLLAEYTDDGRIRIEYQNPDENLVVRGLPRGYDPGHTYTLDVRADPILNLLVVRRDDTVMLDAYFSYDGHDYLLGENPATPGVEARFPGRISERPTSAPLCRRLIRAERAGRA